MNEQSWKVIENKGPALITAELSWNVVENKGSYALKAAMLLKIKCLGAEEFRIVSSQF